MRAADKGSLTAYNLLEKIFVLRQGYEGIDIPEDDPDWWNKQAVRIYGEERIQGSKKSS